MTLNYCRNIQPKFTLGSHEMTWEVKSENMTLDIPNGEAVTRKALVDMWTYASERFPKSVAIGQWKISKIHTAQIAAMESGFTHPNGPISAGNQLLGHPASFDNDSDHSSFFYDSSDIQVDAFGSPRKV